VNLLDQLREFDLLLASDPAIEYRSAIKLLSGKITFVHRPLWASIFAIGTARERKLMSSGDGVRER
jgi:hypothetical protein